MDLEHLLLSLGGEISSNVFVVGVLWTVLVRP